MQSYWGSCSDADSQADDRVLVNRIVCDLALTRVLKALGSGAREIQ